jgi:serine/threonine protein kinase
MRTDNNYYLVLEYCNGGDLQSYLKHIGKANEDVAREIVR